MCTFDIHFYPHPCHTFLYRLVQPCRRPVRRCMNIILRQRHVRREGPCRQPSVCNWCSSSVPGLDKLTMMKNWRLARSSAYIPTTQAFSSPPTPTLPEQNFRDITANPEASSGNRSEGITVYLGTTYYVPPEVFHREVLPELQKRQKENGSVYYDGPPAIGSGGPSRDIQLLVPTQQRESNTPPYLSGSSSQAIDDDEEGYEGYGNYEGYDGGRALPPPSSPAIHYQQVEIWRFGEMGYLYADGTAYCEWKFKEQPNECEKFRYIVNHHYLTPPPLPPQAAPPAPDL